ncbi:MAG: hypothetical protein ACREP9_06090 [Candidatus Dormibacteraceae bacterium]
MGPTMINGLPAHVFLVHIVVIFVPLAALLLIMTAVWPAARRRLGIVTPIVALIALASIPPTTHAGSWLKKRVDPDPLVTAHAHLADGLLPWVAGLFVVSAALWLFQRKQQHWLNRSVRHQHTEARVPAGVGASPTDPTPEFAAEKKPTPAASSTWLKAASTVAIIAALIVSVGSVVEVYRIGDSGARAAWHDNFSLTPVAPAKSGDGH